MKHYDAVIIGGGLVGASLILALRGSGLRIALIEAVARRADSQPSYDDRTLALNRVSCRVLDELGLWPAMSNAATPIKRIHVSDRGRFGRVRLSAAEHGLKAFGHVVQARSLGAAMLPALDDVAELDVYCPARLEQMKVGNEAVQIQLADGAGELAAKLVIGADGAASRVRQLMAMSAREHDYRQTAVIANITAQRNHDFCAYERLTETGPLALLPHGPQRMGLVWSVASGEANQLLKLDNETFLRGLQERFGYRLGRFQRVGQRTAYPLRLVHVKQPVARRTVLIGNAAHTIHPISAQGFNLGLRDAIRLAAELRQAQLNGDDAGGSEVLNAYQTQRDQDQQNTIRYTDGLVRMFSNPSAGFGALRSAALLAHQCLPPMQRRLITGAMGYRGVLPGLARDASFINPSNRTGSE